MVILCCAIATMLEMNIENRASKKSNLSLMKNIDGAKFYYVHLKYVN